MIYLIGAFDRFNYGDLLFPKILRFVFESSGMSQKTKLLGIVDADLTRNGGDCVESLSRYITSFTENDALIIVGGEVVGATFADIFFYLRKAEALYILNKFLIKIKAQGITNQLCRKLLGINLRFPFLFSANEVKCRVIYNAVGGRFDDTSVLAPIRDACYFSTRSGCLYKGLIRHYSSGMGSEKIALYPDCVSVMTDFYKIDEIRKHVYRDNIDVFDTVKYKYVAFQTSKEYYLLHRKVILYQLKQLFEKTQLPILLVPVGLALRHEDDYACQDIKLSLTIPLYSIKSETIFDIMYAIANAKLLVATSLHAHITAMSYGVPNVGIGGHKLDDYLKTWGWGLQSSGCVSPEIISDFALRVIDQDCNRFRNSQLQHKQLAYKNLLHIVRILQQS